MCTVPQFFLLYNTKLQYVLHRHLEWIGRNNTFYTRLVFSFQDFQITREVLYLKFVWLILLPCRILRKIEFQFFEESTTFETNV